MALPLVAVSTLHAGPTMVALLTAAGWLPWLLIGLPAGVWVDRWPRRRTLLAADLGSAAVLIAVPVAAWAGVLSVPILLAAALLAGTAGIFFNVAFVVMQAVTSFAMGHAIAAVSLAWIVAATPLGVLLVIEWAVSQAHAPGAARSWSAFLGLARAG